jgi:transmembrane sensor
MKYYQKVEDFLLDQSFQAWLEGDAEATTFWLNWRSKNPDKLAVLNQAKAMVYTLKQHPPAISSNEVTQEVNELVRQVRQRKQATVLTEDPDSAEPVRLWPLSAARWLRIAASVLVVVGIGLGYRLFRSSTNQNPSVYHQLLSKAPALLLEKVNPSNQPLTIVLSDGSAITLEKASRISYPKTFSGDFREVYLSGEAFFEVAHNPKQPFLVYANETVTKVLGTSFRIRAFESDQEVKVAVKTGKVSVYAKTTFKKENLQKGNEFKGVLLIPNQEVVFDRATESLQKGLVENRS